MNLDELRSVQAKERRKDSLQHLRDSFYDDVAAYISDLRAARDRRAAAVDKPFSDDDVRRMSDEIETAEEVAEALYERRVGKVVKLASFAAADMPVETEGLTTQERDLFDDLVDRIGENKSTVLDALAGETTPTTASVGAGDDSRTATDVVADPATESGTVDSPDTSGPATAPSPTDGASDRTDDPEPVATDDADGSGGDGALASAMGNTESDSSPDEPSTSIDDSAEPTPVDPEPAPPGAPGVSDGGRIAEREDGAEAGDMVPDEETERTTVRITRDVGSILGVDEREYDLATEDVVTLPAANADPLVQRDAAERID
ncbi:hypothetical protein [Halorubrum sp. DTA98]|uniref:DNA replication complex subunit Gins51 n=1 Tax=Halorubrum sp. DTA98 TaxID=3402163 RepID=UPI003AAA2474